MDGLAATRDPDGAVGHGSVGAICSLGRVGPPVPQRRGGLTRLAHATS